MLTQKSDEELIRIIRGAAEPDRKNQAMDKLLNRYKDFVRQRTRSYFLIGADRDDLIQEGMIGLYKAIIGFDPEHDASFRTFADLCVRRQIQTAVKQSTRMKHYPLNSSISLNSTTVQEDGEDQELTLMDQLASGSIVNPEVIYVSREEKLRIEKELLEALSPLECKVLGLFVTGLDYQEIATVLNRTPKSIDNALQRARHKAAKIVSPSDN